MENGLDNLIKHEEVSNDNGAGSPGNDPSNDGNQGSGPSNDSQKIAKTETGETHTRGRNRSSGNSAASAVNTNSSNASLAVDNPIGTISEEHIIPTPVVHTTSGRKGNKRKAKHHDNDDNPSTSKVLSVGVALNMPAAEATGASVDEHGESSVKDLENAMSKHLPSPINNNTSTNNNNTNHSNNNTTTDFSADSLLKQQQQDKGSTIQWIGGHHNPFQQTAPMPATALLRQLYANRESVIRATARQASNGTYYSGTFSLNLS